MPEAQAVEKHGDDYDVTCDCGAQERLSAGGATWTHGCKSFDPLREREVRVTLRIDVDGHMTQEIG